jgi:hypothetical protein
VIENELMVQLIVPAEVIKEIADRVDKTVAIKQVHVVILLY